MHSRLWNLKKPFLACTEPISSHGHTKSVTTERYRSPLDQQVMGPLYRGAEYVVDFLPENIAPSGKRFDK